MVRPVLVVALVVGLTIGATAPQATRRQSPVRSVTTNIVVTEDGTTAVGSPAAADLTIRSNGVAVPLTDLAPAAPVSAVLLLDVSISMSEAMASFVWDGQGSLDDVSPSGYKPPDSPSALLLAPVLRGLVRHVTPADRVRVGRIAHQPELGPDFSNDRGALQQAVRWAVDVDGDQRHRETPIWDALDAAIDVLEREVGRRRVVVLVTDGLSTGNRSPFDQVLERANNSDVAVFVVGEAWQRRSPIGYAGRPPWVLMSGAFESSPLSRLRRLAGATGGVFVLDGDRAWPELERRLTTVLALLRATHAVTFASPLVPGETGILTIDVAGSPAREAHVKQYYRVPLPQPTSATR